MVLTVPIWGDPNCLHKYRPCKKKSRRDPRTPEDSWPPLGVASCWGTAGSLHGQSTDQRRTVDTFPSFGRGDPGVRDQRGPQSGDGKCPALWDHWVWGSPTNGDPGLPSPGGKRGGLGEKGRTCAHQTLAPPPRPHPRWVRAPASRLGLCNPGTWQLSEQRSTEGRDRRREERRGGGGGGGKHRPRLAHRVVHQKDSWRTSPPLPSPSLPQFPLTLLSAPPTLAWGLRLWENFLLG